MYTWKEKFKPFYKNGERGAWNRIPNDIEQCKSEAIKSNWEITWEHYFDHE